MIRYGIVGCAGIGEIHADGVNRSDAAALIACADLDERAGESFAAEYGCEYYPDHVEMIESANLDAVSVCTPSGTHADIAISSLDAGAHVLCEKPLDVKLDRVDRMVEAAANAESTLSGVFQHRWEAGPRRAKAAVEDGELGGLVLADVSVKWYRGQEYYDQADWRGTREMDGGVLMNQAIHGIDLLQWLAGDVRTVSADLGTVARDIAVEDTAVIDLRFDSGALGQVAATTATRPPHPIRLELNGETGSLHLRDDRVDFFETDEGEVPVEHDDWSWGDAHAAQIHDFAEAVRDGRTPPVPPSDARTAVDIVLAAYESDARGEPVAPGEL